MGATAGTIDGGGGGEEKGLGRKVATGGEEIVGALDVDGFDLLGVGEAVGDVVDGG